MASCGGERVKIRFLLTLASAKRVSCRDFLERDREDMPTQSSEAVSEQDRVQ